MAELFTMTHPSLVALHSMAHSIIELDKAVVHVLLHRAVKDQITVKHSASCLVHSRPSVSFNSPSLLSTREAKVLQHFLRAQL